MSFKKLAASIVGVTLAASVIFWNLATDDLTSGIFRRFFGDHPKRVSATQAARLLTQDLWWKPEYPTLLEKLKVRGNLAGSWEVQGGATVTALLLTNPDGGVVLRLELPNQAVFTVDPKTGERTNSATTPSVIMRDHDADGYPDDFRISTAAQSPATQLGSDEQFTPFERDSPEHQGIFAQWSIGVGFLSNYHLHGISSALRE